jgi:hypothetical protein
MLEIICGYTDPPHVHEYPDDWEFGGADGLHPGADTRYRATTYYYLDERLDVVFLTQQYLCDDEALDRFTDVAKFGSPVYLQAKRPNGTKTLLPWVYDKTTDEVSRRG